MDISAKAIKQARALGRPRATYEVADILTYLPREAYDAILLREVIYYLPEVDPDHPTAYLLGKSGSDASPPARRRWRAT